MWMTLVLALADLLPPLLSAYEGPPPSRSVVGPRRAVLRELRGRYCEGRGPHLRPWAIRQIRQRSYIGVAWSEGLASPTFARSGASSDGDQAVWAT